MNPCPCGFLLGGSESYTPGRYEEKYERATQIEAESSADADARVGTSVENVEADATNDNEEAANTEAEPSAIPGSPTASATSAGPKACTCTAAQIRRYLSKISGPLLDCIDIHIEMDAAHPPKTRSRSESSAKVQKRVVEARERQRARQGEKLNARLRGKGLRSVCPLDEGAQNALSAAAEQFSLSRSRLESLLRVARTIADLEGCEGIETQHVEEAINYRSFAKKIFA